MPRISLIGLARDAVDLSGLDLSPGLTTAKLRAGFEDRFRAWFEAFDAEQFDRRLVDDAEAGKLDRFADEAQADLRQGNVRKL